MGYAITTIWHERSRFLPAIFAVGFSALLIALQAGLLVGLLSMMSTPVDKSRADVWVGYPGVRSVDLGQPIPESWVSRLARQPEVERVEPCVMGFSLWTVPARGGLKDTTEACMVVGTRLHRDALGVVEPLRGRPGLLAALAEPGAVVIDESEVGRLGIRGIGDRAEMFGVGVRVVGLVRGLKSLGGPYVFCSLETGRLLLRHQPQYVTYLLARCKEGTDAGKVARRLENYPRMAAFTSAEFSLRSRLHWLTTTKAGVALGFAASLGLLVGAVVTSQTLYAATVASQREYATLRAMGIPRWRLRLAVMAQSFWVGLGGVLLALPATYLLAEVANRLGTQVRLAPAILGSAALITLGMALLSGLAALRSLQGVDPAHNIR